MWYTHSTMNNFKKEGFRKGGASGGGRPAFGGAKRGGGSFGGGRERGGTDRFSERRELFPATCSSCHKACEVPFRPSGDKPVFCRDCFANKDQSGGHEFRGGDRSGADAHREYRPQRDAPHRYETPTPSKESGVLLDVQRQLVSLESKVTRILTLLDTAEGIAAPTHTPVTLREEAPKKLARVVVKHAKKVTPIKKKIAKKAKK